MKKAFKLTAENKAPERQVDSIKYEIRKYISRERRKKTPDNIDFWDFDCKIGEDSTSSTSIHIKDINNKISEFAKLEKDSIYIEILSKPGHKKQS